MTVSTISNRDFQQDVDQAQRNAEAGPVVITDRGRPAWVLMRHDAWRRLAAERSRIRPLLAQDDAPDDAEPEFDPPRLGGGLFGAAGAA
jgi:antitoxin (DNA-binding transcriptional repressor) of toxin-antitoxin stability system